MYLQLEKNLENFYKKQHKEIYNGGCAGNIPAMTNLMKILTGYILRKLETYNLLEVKATSEELPLKRYDTKYSLDCAYDASHHNMEEFEREYYSFISNSIVNELIMEGLEAFKDIQTETVIKSDDIKYFITKGQYDWAIINMAHLTQLMIQGEDVKFPESMDEWLTKVGNIDGVDIYLNRVENVLHPMIIGKGNVITYTMNIVLCCGGAIIDPKTFEISLSLRGSYDIVINKENISMVKVEMDAIGM